MRSTATVLLLPLLLLLLCYLSISHAWSCTQQTQLSYVQQVDAGMGRVMVTDRYRRVYQLSGSSWYRLGSASLQHVTVGPSGTWGTSTSNRVYKYVAGTFKIVNGLSMKQVDAGGDGQLVGVLSSGYGYCMRELYALSYVGVGSASWTYLSLRLKYVSCGPLYGCWGIHNNNQVYVIQSITPSSCSSGSRVSVSGPTMTMIDVSTDGKVFGVATNGDIYQRIGISSSRRQGTSWSKVLLCEKAKHVAYDLRHLWVVNTSGRLMKCTP